MAKRYKKKLSNFAPKISLKSIRAKRIMAGGREDKANKEKKNKNSANNPVYHTIMQKRERIYTAKKRRTDKFGHSIH